MPRWTQTPKERLISKIERLESGCWKWLGSKNKKGYGMMVYKGRIHASHRVSWQEYNGPIPDGMLICHKCDNPSCVNPDHLFVGSNQDNMDDMKEKGRHWHKTPRGEQNKNSKLTWDQVREIRASEHLTVRELANKYGVTDVTIYYVLNKGWKEA